MGDNAILKLNFKPLGVVSSARSTRVIMQSARNSREPVYVQIIRGKNLLQIIGESGNHRLCCLVDATVRDQRALGPTEFPGFGLFWCQSNRTSTPARKLYLIMFVSHVRNMFLKAELFFSSSRKKKIKTVTPLNICVCVYIFKSILKINDMWKFVIYRNQSDARFIFYVYMKDQILTNSCCIKHAVELFYI